MAMVAGKVLGGKAGGPVAVVATDLRGKIVQWGLVGVTVSFLSLFVVVPAVNVFREALSKGGGAYVGTFWAPKMGDISKLRLRERVKARKERGQAEKNWSSIRMRLGVAAVAVPL